MKTLTGVEVAQLILDSDPDEDGGLLEMLLGHQIETGGYTFQVLPTNSVKPGDHLIEEDYLTALIHLDWRAHKSPDFNPRPPARDGHFEGLNCVIYRAGPPPIGSESDPILILTGWPQPVAVPDAIEEAFSDDR